jgi:cell division protein FtsZ
MFDISENSNIALGAKIKVIGVGGGGCNAVNTMIRSGLTGVEYIVANTDSQALAASLAATKIQLGGNVTKGLGAGANPEVGRKSAIEDYERLSEVLEGADMVFVTAGMGGGTGTGAAPVIAKLAREMGSLTVGVVTKPFMFEGKKRSRQAEEGIRALEESVDSLICIPNQRLLQLAGENLSLVDTFRAADEVLLNAVQGISDLINNTGLINADFADVSTVMTNKGLSLMGTGMASGTERAMKAARQAISSPLLEDVSINGATGIIINITGNASLTTYETNQAVSLIMEAADEDAEIIFGTVIDDSMGDSIKVTVIATGLQTLNKERSIPSPTTSYSAPVRSAQVAAPEAPVSVAPAMVAAPAAVAKPELPTEAPVAAAPRTDYAPKNESSFEFEREEPKQAERPKINWAEKLQSAASKYESQKSFDGSSNSNSNTNQNYSRPATPAEKQELTREFDAFEAKQEETRAPMAAQNSQPQSPAAAQSREGRIKSIAEKLGFFNFDEDEFDTPSFMKKNDRGHDSQI